jgi:hypothetical protein
MKQSNHSCPPEREQSQALLEFLPQNVFEKQAIGVGREIKRHLGLARRFDVGVHGGLLSVLAYHSPRPVSDRAAGGENLPKDRSVRF